MTTGPRYETLYELGQRIGRTGRIDSFVCTGCGVFVMDKAAHTRFHSELRAGALAEVIGDAPVAEQGSPA